MHLPPNKTIFEKYSRHPVDHHHFGMVKHVERQTSKRKNQPKIHNDPLSFLQEVFLYFYFFSYSLLKSSTTLQHPGNLKQLPSWHHGEKLGLSDLGKNAKLLNES